ncbi:MAG: aspartate carbamoyltransferase catalytic subunit, partial [Gammaproteobacteria bacterium]|nr:aspartate carbamoyltransferase catalytic subunit [Gammaproteobacteria bacterium]
MTTMPHQLDSDGRLHHLLTLEGLPRETLVGLLDRAQAIVDGGADRSILSGVAVCTLFFE